MCVCVRETHRERNIEFSIQILIQMCGTSILSVEAATSQSQQAERHQNTEHQPITNTQKDAKWPPWPDSMVGFGGISHSIKLKTQTAWFYCHIYHKSKDNSAELNTKERNGPWMLSQGDPSLLSLCVNRNTAELSKEETVTNSKHTHPHVLMHTHMSMSTQNMFLNLNWIRTAYILKMMRKLSKAPCRFH